MGKRKDHRPHHTHGMGSWGKLPDGRYWARLTLPNGKRKAFYGKTEKDAREKMETFARDLREGKALLGKSSILSEYLGIWLEDVATPTVAPRTLIRYKELCNLHIIPELGNTKLDKLTPQNCQTLYRKKLQKLSPATVNRIHSCLHVALKTAVEWDLIVRNPCDAAKPPKEDKYEPEFLTPEQSRKLLAAASGDKWEALYYVALTTSLRLSEMRGLKWSDVDLENGVLQMRQQIQRIPKEGFKASQPKNKKSQRSIALAGSTIEALRRHHIRQKEQRLSIGSKWVEHNLVFPNGHGKPFDESTLYRSHKRLLEKAGMPHIRIHGLRHSAASLLLSLGVHPKIVQEMLGHSQISVTMDTYSHVMPSLQKEAVSRLNELLKP